MNLSVFQWLGLIALAMVLLPLAMGVVLEATLVMWRAVHELNRHAG